MNKSVEILRAENISKAFGNTQACNNVTLSLARGEVHGLIGENGSGKSTFASMLCGVYAPDGGTFYLDGEEYSAHTQVEANEKGVAIIVQEIGTLSGLTVAQNIFLGKEDRFTHFGILRPHKLNRTVNEILKRYGFDYINAGDMIDSYDYEIRKLVEIVKATHFGPKIVVVDETTTALSQDGRDILYDHIKKISDSGNTVLFISHDLDEVLQLTDRVSVLRDGRYVDTVVSSESSTDQLKLLMVGREIDRRYYRTDYGGAISEEVVLRARNINVKGKIFDIDLDVHKGEILGIGGLSDCGMHDLAKAFFGAAYDRSGEIATAAGVKINSIPDAIKNGIAYTAKDRDNESVVLNASIRDNITLLSLPKVRKGPVISRTKEKQFAQRLADQMSVKMQGIEQFVAGLSGGNKQKVVLARWLGTEPQILILDSPTRGIDIKVKADIYSLMDNLRKEGRAIVMISEELMELIGMCDRILVLKNGRINGEFFRSKELTEHDLIHQML
ncbi:sugar ABC transporter ATP-binding protein [Sediminispirochaeta bajacaliforniensis]|uniref:sugar ABC transporter ATP-binding protein n=1 Tax=Sediminispirochaeta bajacaliforniensis TaxID=148 RepID=UPI00035D8936|nr:sugar ABC transporter ATP-binding protein [Sediminispirochaeta bajacaliforniensis]